MSVSSSASSETLLGIVGKCVTAMTTDAELTECERLLAEAGRIVAARKDARAAEALQTTLTATCNDLCDSVKHPAYANFHAVLRSMQVLPGKKRTFRARYDEKDDKAIFYVWYKETGNAVFMTEDDKELTLNNNCTIDTAGADLRKFPPRVIAFLYAMKEGGVMVRLM